MTVLVLLMVGTASGARLVHAKCDPGPVKDRLDHAEIVFQGRLIGMKQVLVDRGIVADFMSAGGSTVAWLGEFRVEKVWRGSVGSMVTVLTEPIGCGKPFSGAGGSWVIAAQQVGHHLVAPGCRGIGQHDMSAALALLGAPKKTYDADATEDLLRPAEPAEPDDRRWPTPSAVGVGFLAGMAVASLMVARRRSSWRR